MSDFVRREDVVEALYQAIRTTLTDTFTDSMSLAIAMTNNLPSAELERKNDEWIDGMLYDKSEWEKVKRNIKKIKIRYCDTDTRGK